MNKVLFAASECVPFIKTGGLADVCGALPKEFDKAYLLALSGGSIENILDGGIADEAIDLVWDGGLADEKLK